MIRNSFILLDGIGKRKERLIWEQGIRDWNSFLSAGRVRSVAARAKRRHDRELRMAGRELLAGNSAYFCRLLPPSEQWRLYGFFRDEAVFLDVETDESGKDVTVIGTFDGFETRTMVRGINMDLKALRKELERFRIMVTFNGSVFDLPLIRRRFGGVLPEMPHFDLRFCCSKIGLAGGLKKIEKMLGIRREGLAAGIRGGDAALLHRMWRGSGDEHYLNALVEYNGEDVINLKKIADHAYGELCSERGFENRLFQY